MLNNNNNIEDNNMDNTKASEVKPSDNTGGIAESSAQSVNPDIANSTTVNAPAEGGQQMAVTTPPDAGTVEQQPINNVENTGQENMEQVDNAPEVSKYADIINKKMKAEKQANLDQYEAIRDILNQPDGKNLAKKVVARFHNSEEVDAIIKVASKAGFEWLVQYGFAIAAFCIGKLEKRHKVLDAVDLKDVIKKRIEAASDGNTSLSPDDLKAIIDATIFKEKVRADDLDLAFENIFEAYKKKIVLSMPVLKALKKNGVDLNQSVVDDIESAEKAAA